MCSMSSCFVTSTTSSDGPYSLRLGWGPACWEYKIFDASGEEFIENRSRFNPIEITDAVVKAVGAECTSMRISPWGTYQSTFLARSLLFSHFIKSVLATHPKLAYLHAVEPEEHNSSESNDFLREIWARQPLIIARLYTRDTAMVYLQRTHIQYLPSMFY